MLVLQDGKEVCSVCEGYQNWKTKEPLRPDALYRLASMTKPVTGVATMIAVDKGFFKITDKVADYLPEFSNMYVGKYENEKIVPGEKAQKDLQIWHLLSHCSGIMPDTPMGLEITKAAPRLAYQSRDSLIAYAAAQPLAFEPETYTAYTALVALDMVAKIIERKSGMSYAEFVGKHIFEPLGIKNLTYFPTEDQWERTLMPTDRVGGQEMVSIDLGKHTFEAVPLSYAGAGAGLVGSITDYAVFAEMIRNGGVYNDVRLFSPERFREMITPYVPLETPGRDPVSSWGLGVRVVDRESILPIGTIWHSGAYGTHFWIDPLNKITAIYMRSSRWYDCQSDGVIIRSFEKDVMDCLEN